MSYFQLFWRQLAAVSALLFTSYGLAESDPDFEFSTLDGFTIHIHSQLQPIKINQIHSWYLELSDSDGRVSGAVIEVKGGMPEHDHGLPTQAQVTEEIQTGVYLIEGIRFHMPGLWNMDFTITYAGEISNVTLEFQL